MDGRRLRELRGASLSVDEVTSQAADGRQLVQMDSIPEGWLSLDSLIIQPLIDIIITDRGPSSQQTTGEKSWSRLFESINYGF